MLEPLEREPDEGYLDWQDEERARFDALSPEQQAAERNEESVQHGSRLRWTVKDGTVVRDLEAMRENERREAAARNAAHARFRRAALATGGYCIENGDGTTAIRLGPLARGMSRFDVAALHSRGLAPLPIFTRPRAARTRRRRACASATSRRARSPGRKRRRRSPADLEAAA